MATKIMSFSNAPFSSSRDIAGVGLNKTPTPAICVLRSVIIVQKIKRYVLSIGLVVDRLKSDWVLDLFADCISFLKVGK